MKPFHMGYIDEFGDQYESTKTDFEADTDWTEQEFSRVIDFGLETCKIFGNMLIISETRIKTI